MTGQFAPLVPASVAFDASGIPVSLLYGDVYHSRSGALAQAEHVFLSGNQLPGRWRGRTTFTVCETGFGLGHNFLALWHAWRTDPDRCARLHVVSFEAHPFSRADLAQLIVPALPDALRALAGQLLTLWPPLLPGLHRLEFESGALTLTLAFGTVKRLATQISACVDAYFLDGFAPKKNPEMWTPSLFGQMARMANVGATAASWCCATPVRRALSNAGFLVSKVPGLGRKREMTVAVLRPTMGRQLTIGADREPVLIVGGGFAGAGIAYGLALRGHPVTVLDPVFADGPGGSHRGHRAAALAPLISRDDDFRARLSRAGVACALQRWQTLPPAAAPWRCGAINLVATAQDALERQTTIKRLGFPQNWVSWLNPAAASERIGFEVRQGGVFFADGQLLRPPMLVQALLGQAGVRCIAARAARLQTDAQGRWLVNDACGALIASASTLVLANAAQAFGLLSTAYGMEELPKMASMLNLAGQVSHFSAGSSQHDPRLIVGGDGYWLPSVDNVCVGGSTYVSAAHATEVTQGGHQAIIDKLARLLNVTASRINQWLDHSGGWAGWRAVVSDRLPVVGPVAGVCGLWLACAYGSRGLTWSALAGEVVAAKLSVEPAPIERELLRAIAPR
jgi:tRNA 5-methylaminomethyl-2-thiouridine biosynthesis bifunctional protein